MAGVGTEGAIQAGPRIILGYDLPQLLIFTSWIWLLQVRTLVSNIEGPEYVCGACCSPRIKTVDTRLKDAGMYS